MSQLEYFRQACIPKFQNPLSCFTEASTNSSLLGDAIRGMMGVRPGVGVFMVLVWFCQWLEVELLLDGLFTSILG